MKTYRGIFVFTHGLNDASNEKQYGAKVIVAVADSIESLVKEYIASDIVKYPLVHIDLNYSQFSSIEKEISPIYDLLWQPVDNELLLDFWTMIVDERKNVKGAQK